MLATPHRGLSSISRVDVAFFQKKEIRKTLHENEWWFVIIDVVAALTDSVNRVI
jgi:prophage antirepressor-like protein